LSESRPFGSAHFFQPGFVTKTFCQITNSFFFLGERERVKRLIILNDDKSSVWAEFLSTHVLHHTPKRTFSKPSDSGTDQQIKNIIETRAYFALHNWIRRRQ